tara:strand:+ start:1354 stop:1686 length:333 start_codon:yes stop_codon:yes gene_type:complete
MEENSIMQEKTKATPPKPHPPITFEEGNGVTKIKDEQVRKAPSRVRSMTKKEVKQSRKKLDKKLGVKQNGLGSRIERAINKVTGGKVKSCSGCKKRRDALNKMFPGKKNK